MFQIKTNKKPHLCQAYRCMANKAPKKRFCHKHHARFQNGTNYIELKGKTKKSASINRIDPRKGYEIGNIQVLSLQANSSKGCNPPDDDLPF